MEIKEVNNIKISDDVLDAINEPFLKIFEKIPKEMYTDTYSHSLQKYKPFDAKFFVDKKYILNKINRFQFYIDNYKHFIPFLFRKNRKINFTYYVVNKSKKIQRIKAINNILNKTNRNETQDNKQRTRLSNG